MTVSATPETGRAETGRTGTGSAGRQTRDLTTDHRLVQLFIGAVTVAAAILVAAEHRTDAATALALALVVGAYGVLSAIDVKEQRLPNRITLPLAGLTILAVLTTGLTNGELVRALAAIGVGIGFSLLLGLFQFGMGDVKLAITVGTIAGWFGRDVALATIYIGAAGGAAAAVILMVRHRRRDVTFGFGPFLAIGSVAGMLLAG